MGKAIVCTYTNALKPATLRLNKTWVPNAIAGNAVTVSTTGGSANATVSSTATAAGNTTGGTPVNVSIGNTITLPAETFNTGTASNYTSTVTCNNTTTPLTNATLPASFTVDAGDTAVVCTYTNTIKTASLTLRKTWVTAQVNNAVNVTATGLTPLASVANTASETDTAGVQSVTAGSAITLAETFNTGSAINYASALACTGNATPLAGNVLTVNGADTAIVCTFTNTRRLANLSIVKTANPINVQTGGTVVFTLTVNNDGPAAANGSILRDKPGTGLTCTAAPTCSASGGASCPSPAALTANAITSNAGVAIPVLPAGGQAVVTFTCVATASGQ